MTHSDSQLIDKARTGDSEAFAMLWQRHSSAAHWAAERVARSADCEDIVQESFTRLFAELQQSPAGSISGPFRQYVYVMVRSVADASITHNESPLAAAQSLTLDDSFTENFADHALVNKAYSSLSPQWRSILWYTEVEELTPAEIAPLLGISANAVSALAYRAREGLRASWLQAHITTAPTEPACEWTVERLGMYARGSLSARHTTKIHAHLKQCTSCSVLLNEVNTAADQLRSSALVAILGISLALIKPSSTAATTTAQVFSAVDGGAQSSALVSQTASSSLRTFSGLAGSGSAPLVGTVAASIALVAIGVAVAQSSQDSAPNTIATGIYTSTDTPDQETSTDVASSFFGQTAQFVSSTQNVTFHSVEPPRGGPIGTTNPGNVNPGNPDGNGESGVAVDRDLPNGDPSQPGSPSTPNNPSGNPSTGSPDATDPHTSTPSQSTPDSPNGSGSNGGGSTQEPSNPSSQEPSTPSSGPQTPSSDPTPSSTPTSTPTENPSTSEPEYVPVFFAERIDLSNPQKVTFGGTGPFYGDVTVQDESGVVVGHVVIGGDSRWSITVTDTYTAALRTTMTYRLFLSESGNPAELKSTITATGLG